MNRFEPTTESGKKIETQENHEAPRSVEKSTEEISSQMIEQSGKEVADFQQEGATELAQSQARAEKDGLVIDDVDKEELKGLNNESNVAKEELVAEIASEPIALEENVAVEKAQSSESVENIKSKRVCPKCGREGKENSNFCEECGGKMETQQVRVCLGCGKENKMGNKFCEDCGGKFEKAESEVEKANIIEVVKDKNFEGSVIVKTEDTEGRIVGYALRKNSNGELEGNKIGYMKDGSVGAVYQLHESDFTSLGKNGVLEEYENTTPESLGDQQGSLSIEKPGEIAEEKSIENNSGAENVPTMKERVIESPELLSEKEASKKLLAEERIKLAQEIREQRNAQGGRLSRLKNVLEAGQEKLEGEQGDKQFGRLSKLQSSEANLLAERISSEELNEQDAGAEKENMNQLIDNSEKLKSIKEKIKEHYEKADGLAKERFDTLNRSLENVIKRNNAFIVHKIAEREGVRHNENSNVSSEATYQDDIDILLALEPSISASSVTPGEKAKLWPGSSGLLLGGGQIGEAGSTDIGTVSYGIKDRGRKASSINEIDKIVGRNDESSKSSYERFGSHIMNEVVVNNPEIFGFFQHAGRDESGIFWADSVENTKHLSVEMPEYFGSGPDDYANRLDLKSTIDPYRERFAVASERGIPLYIMTDNREVYECLNVNDDGTIEVGKQITPEEVAAGRAGLPPEKRKEIGERILEKKLFKKQETIEEAKEIISSL